MRKSFAILGLSVAAAAMTIPAMAASPAPITLQAREPHPEIRSAIMSLERAKYAMQHASHDFGGHRVAALAATDKAIEQLRIALKYDKE
jgi:hypothetical protein